MKGKMVFAIGLALIVASSHVNRPAHAATVKSCRDAKITGIQPRMICEEYVKLNCLAPQPHDSAECIDLRQRFREVSGGKDLDDLLTREASTQVLIPAAGGFVTLPNVGTVTFSSGAFDSDTFVDVAKGSNPSVNSTFEEFASIFRPTNRLSYEITVTTGSRPPISETIDLLLDLPVDFRAQVPADYSVDLFAMVEQASDLDLPYKSFELFNSQYASNGARLAASVPGAVFFLDADGRYKAVFTLAPTPGTKQSFATQKKSALAQLYSTTLSTSDCEAVAISCPIEGGCEPTSAYNPARRHPVTGVVRPHYGVDYRAPTGTPLYAAADGRIERSYNSDSYGQTIIIRHNDGGATLYAHLQRRDVGEHAVVTKGQQIGTANNTGLSSGPHLHMEYVPNGAIVQSKNRINPDACINGGASGSVTVRDSGNLADDSFEVFIDGVSVGRTEIGASNTLAISNLRAGNHALELTVLVAPDDVGTYTVELSDGLRFADGSTTKVGNARQGASVTWQFIAP